MRGKAPPLRSPNSKGAKGKNILEPTVIPKKRTLRLRNLFFVIVLHKQIPLPTVRASE